MHLKIKENVEDYNLFYQNEMFIEYILINILTSFFYLNNINNIDNLSIVR
jgi:hypothetical protein